jgi:hypothetical protein
MEQAFDVRERGPTIAAEYRTLVARDTSVENRASICYNNER